MEEGSCRENNMKKQTKIPQINKNNKSKPENLLKKEYIETLEKLKKDIREEQN
jgi:dynactin complex subunit